MAAIIHQRLGATTDNANLLRTETQARGRKFAQRLGTCLGQCIVVPEFRAALGGQIPAVGIADQLDAHDAAFRTQSSQQFFQCRPIDRRQLVATAVELRIEYLSGGDDQRARFQRAKRRRDGRQSRRCDRRRRDRDDHRGLRDLRRKRSRRFDGAKLNHTRPCEARLGSEREGRQRIRDRRVGGRPAIHARGTGLVDSSPGQHGHDLELVDRCTAIDFDAMRECAIDSRTLIGLRLRSLSPALHANADLCAQLAGKEIRAP